jgi:hypothetical protein
MNAQIRRLEKLLEAADNPKEKARITKLIEAATRDAQKANQAARKMAREIAKIEEDRRAMDTQRKIVAGAIFLSEMARDESFHKRGVELLKKYAEKRYWFYFPEAFTPDEIDQANAEVQAARNKDAATKAKERMQEIAGEFAAKLEAKIGQDSK